MCDLFALYLDTAEIFSNDFPKKLCVSIVLWHSWPIRGSINTNAEFL